MPSGNLQGLLGIVARHRKGNIRKPMVAGILNDHVHHNIRRGNTPKEFGRDAWPVRQPRQGDFGLVFVGVTPATTTCSIS